MIVFAVILTCLMLLVIMTDATRYIIPNWLVLALLLLYPALFLLTTVQQWQTALLIALAVFIAGFVLSLFRILGGGDIKLLTVLALYAGEKCLGEFLIMVAILGGALTLILLGLRPLTAFLLARLEHPPEIPRVLTDGEPIPYGVTIAIAFLVLLWRSQLPGLTL